MENQQQKQHDDSLLRQNRLTTLFEENEDCVRTLFDVTTASLFCAEAFAREQIHLDQGKMRDYILYNGGFADQPTSPITVAELLPELENVLSTGAGFLVESGEANSMVTVKVFEVLNTMAHLVEEERLATREAQATAEAAIASSRAAEMRVSQLERKIQQMEEDMNKMKEERTAAMTNTISAAEREADNNNNKEQEDQENEENEETKKKFDDDDEDKEDQKDLETARPDENINNKGEEDDEKKSPAPMNADDLGDDDDDNNREEQQDEDEDDNRSSNNNNYQHETATSTSSRNLLRPVSEDSNLVSPFAFFTKKSPNSRSQSAATATTDHHQTNNNFTMPNVNANTFKTPSKSVTHHQNNNKMTSSLMRSYSVDDGHNPKPLFKPNQQQQIDDSPMPRSLSSQARQQQGVDEDGEIYDTYIVNNRPFVAPRWASASVFSQVSADAAKNAADRSQSVYEPPSKPLERKSDILEVVMGTKREFSPQDLDWGRSVTADPYRQEEHDRVWDEHSRITLEHSDMLALEEKRRREAAGDIDDDDENDADDVNNDENNNNNNNNNNNQMISSNAWVKQPSNNNSVTAFCPSHGNIISPERKPVEYYSPSPEKLKDEDRVPKEFIHPADRLKQQTSAQEIALANRENNNNNHNNFDDTISDMNTNTNTTSQQFLLSDHMRHGEAQAIISVASGVARNSDDYAIDTTLDWLKRMSHGPMLQLEQTLLQRDFYEKTPPTGRAARPLMLTQDQINNLVEPSPERKDDDKNNNNDDDQVETVQEPQQQTTPQRGSQLHQQTNNKSSPPASGSSPNKKPAGKPPLAGGTSSAVLSPTTASNSATAKKSPGGKFQALGKKIIATNKTLAGKKAPPSLNNSSFGGKSSAAGSVASNSAKSTPLPAPGAKKSAGTPGAVPTTGRLRSGTIMSKTGSSVANKQPSSLSAKRSPSAPTQTAAQEEATTTKLNVENLTIHTKTLTGGKEVPSASARHEVDPHRHPPRPGQIVETEEEILEHLEKDSNYPEKLLMTQQQQQVALAAAAVVANGNGNNKPGSNNNNAASPSPNPNDTSSMSNTRNSETNSLKQIHSLLGGTQPSCHREAGGQELTPDEVEDTTPQPFKRKSVKETYDIRPHENTMSEDQYFKQSGGVLHALHRVLQQETQERRESEAKAAIVSASSKNKNNNNNTNNARSASGGSYYSEY